MRRVSEAYPSRFARASDYPRGQRMHVRIRGVSEEIFDDRTPYCLWLNWADGRTWEGGLGIVLNKTNAKLCASWFSDDPERWPGYELEVWPEDILVKGEIATTWRMVPVRQSRTDSPPPAPAPTPTPKEVTAPAADTRPRAKTPAKGKGSNRTTSVAADLDDEISF
jgi:hypothetical protein